MAGQKKAGRPRDAHLDAAIVAATVALLEERGYSDLSLAAVAASFYAYGTDFTPAGGLVVLAGLLVFIASHAFGQGAVIWVFISEIFPNRVRAKGQALGSFTHWFMAAAVSWTFPVIAHVSGGHAFALFALMMVLQLLFVVFIMPETKGIPLEEIEKKLGIE